MNTLLYTRAADIPDALHHIKSQARTKFLGGGTNLVDLMRETVERPDKLVDVTGLSHDIEIREDGSVLIGAAATNTAVTAHRDIRERFPVLVRAILAGASGQIRNMATVGGNIMQRTRCYYFFDDTAKCNKRTPGAGCDAAEGFNRIHAILGASPSCVATHPSDMCVALAALDAKVHVEGAGGKRAIALVDFHRLPEDHPDLETQLAADELITAVELPAMPFAVNSVYRKVRDRSSYAFALVSVAAALDVDSNRTVRDVRLAIGGVAHKPWRAVAAEAALRGQPATMENFRAAAEADLAAARPLRDNGFKIELAKRVITASLADVCPGAGL